MSDTLKIVQALAIRGEVLFSDHAYERLEENDIDAFTISSGAASAIALEDYPEAHLGPSVLVLQHDLGGRPVHAVWGLRKGTAGPAVVITVYRPDPNLWSADFRSRK